MKLPPVLRRRRFRRRRAAVVALAVAVLVCGCRQQGAAGSPAVTRHRGPIVFITLDALRADAVGAFGGPPRLTPTLDALAREADFAGPAVAASSWTVPSMASLFTGLQPWRNQNWKGESAILRSELLTLPEALKALGFATTGFRSNVWLSERYGYHQGFDVFRYLREGKRAEAKLASLGNAPEFVWAHILPPHAPYVRHDGLLDRLPDRIPDLPQRVRVVDLEPYFDPETPLPPSLRRRFRAMYELNAAWADQMLGRLLAALRRSGQWDRTLLVVTADHGEEFKDCGQVEHGGTLCRPLVEVPLLVKLPKPWHGPRLSLRVGERAAALRVWATMVEAAGGSPGVGVAPSLFRRAAGGVLSELYQGNGSNSFSLVEGDLQLIWESHFAAPDRDFYRARMMDLGGQPDVPPRQAPAVLFARFEDAFGRTLPLSGRRDMPPTLSLWRWTSSPPGAPPMSHAVARIDDPRLTLEMARRLREAWRRLDGVEAAAGPRHGGPYRLTPEEAAELRNLGYVAGGPRPR